MSVKHMSEKHQRHAVNKAIRALTGEPGIRFTEREKELLRGVARKHYAHVTKGLKNPPDLAQLEALFQ